jgi:hypothetical protein
MSKLHEDLEALRVKHGFLTLAIVAVTLDDPSRGGSAPGYTLTVDAVKDANNPRPLRSPEVVRLFRQALETIAHWRHIIDGTAVPGKG